MSTATPAPKGASIDAARVIVKVRSHATTKLEFLRVLVKKITESSRQGVTATATYAKRAWNWAPAGMTGALVSGFTASRQGYATATGAVRKVISLATGSLVSLIKLADKSIDFVGSTLAWAVSKIWPITGSMIGMANKKFTDLRRQAISYTEATFAGLGHIIKAAYNTQTTVTATTLFSAAISAGFVADSLFGNAATNFFARVPLVGKLFVSALSGGFATAVAILLVATVAAVVSFYLHQQQIIDVYISEMKKAESVKANEKIQSLVDKVTSKMQVVKVQTEDESDNKVIVTSEVVKVDGPDTYIEVTGNITPEEAVRVAEAHVEADLVEFTEVVAQHTPVRPAMPPKQRDYPKGKQNKKRS